MFNNTTVRAVENLISSHMIGTVPNFEAGLQNIINTKTREELQKAAPKLNILAQAAESVTTSYEDNLNILQKLHKENNLWKTVMTKFTPYLGVASILLIAGLATWSVGQFSRKQDA